MLHYMATYLDSYLKNFLFLKNLKRKQKIKEIRYFILQYRNKFPASNENSENKKYKKNDYSIFNSIIIKTQV